MEISVCIVLEGSEYLLNNNLINCDHQNLKEDLHFLIWASTRGLKFAFLMSLLITSMLD